MKTNQSLLSIALGLLVAANGFAASAPSTAAPATPIGSTGLCKDGSYTTTATKPGACAGHKGVKEWFGASAAAPASAGPAAPAPPAKPAKSAMVAAATASAAPAAGGGPGMVWVNGSSNVYHCPDSRYYGKTKQGEYMSEAAAKAAGNHANHAKACS